MRFRFLTLLLCLLFSPLAMWSVAPVALMRVPNGGIQPRVQVDSEGRLHLIYYLGEPSHGDLYYVNRAAGDSAWSDPIRVNQFPNAAVSGGTIRGAQMTLGKGNRLHVVWFGSAKVAGYFSDAAKPPTPLLVSRLADGGKSFESERNLMTWSSVLDGGGSITSDGHGRVWVAWHARGASELDGEMGRNVFIAKSDDDGKTFSVERQIKEAPQGACACCGMRIHYVAPNRLHMVYRGLKGKNRPMVDLWSRDLGESFQYASFNPWEIEACPMSSVALMGDSGRRVIMATEQEGGIRLNQHTFATGRVVPMDHTLDVREGKHPSLALAPDGSLLLTWAEGAGWAKGGVLRWVVRHPDGVSLKQISDLEIDKIPVWSFPAAVYYDQQFHVLF